MQMGRLSSSSNPLDRYDGEENKIENALKSNKALGDGVDSRREDNDDDDMRSVEGPALLHRFQHNTSILCLAAAKDCIFAGTQAGEILVFTLDTYQQEHVISAHHGSVLGLCISDDKKLLFSSAGDRLVNIWSTTTYTNLASIYSLYDVGDIFCISYSSSRSTIYVGCQNTSIQWCNLTSYDSQYSSDPSSHPSVRRDRFFDSPGPGGIRNPKQRASSRGRVKEGIRLLQIPKDHTQQFAHNGYVHAMILTRAPGPKEANSEVLITAGGDGAVGLWTLNDSDRGRPSLLARLDDEREDAESILCIASEGQFLFTGRVDGEINVWDLETRQLLRVLKAFQQDVLNLSLGPGNIFGVSENGLVKTYSPQYECTRVWKAHKGKILASLHVRRESMNVFLTGGNDNTLALWKTDPSTSTETRADRDNEDELLESLRTFISFRTVSSDPKYKGDCHRGASFLRSLLRKFGATTEMINTSNQCNPIVLGKFGSKAKDQNSGERILFYGHYDVIAAENKQGLWIQDPFTMTGQDGFLYGRGASDNKGPVMAAIYAVADIVQSTQLASEIVFLIEGEEERGSRGFEEAVRKNKHLIGDVDWILLANSYWIDDEVPCLTYGLRGVLHATVQIESDLPDLHSGVDGSRILDEPLKDLVMLTSKLTGPRGKVNVPGFDDAINPITKSERILYEEVSHSLVARNPRLGSPAEVAASIMQRWRDASLTIHGFKTSGSEKSTIIPHYASVALSMRLVPNQESHQITQSLKSFLHSEFEALRSKNSLTIKIHHTAEPWLGDPTNEIFRTLERAVQDVWIPKHGRRASLTTPLPPTLNPSHARARSSRASSTKPTVVTTSSALASGNVTSFSDATDDCAVSSPTLRPLTTMSPPLRPSDPASEYSSWRPLYIREGGSIPAIRFLEKEFNAPAAQLPCGQASDNAHLDNERLRVVNLLNSREIFKKVFTKLSRFA